MLLYRAMIATNGRRMSFVMVADAWNCLTSTMSRVLCSESFCIGVHWLNATLNHVVLSRFI